MASLVVLAAAVEESSGPSRKEKNQTAHGTRKVWGTHGALCISVRVWDQWVRFAVHDLEREAIEKVDGRGGGAGLQQDGGHQAWA